MAPPSETGEPDGSGDRDVVEAARPRGGRPRDPDRDTAILEATLEVLAETGYDRLTMNAVAARAGAGKATVYRRWSSKAELVVHAVSQVGDEPVLADLPDTGTIRGDLTALMRPQSAEDDQRTMAVTAGLASLLSADPELADAAGAALVAPFVTSQRLLMQRAVDRGEVGADVDIETIAHVTPSMTAYRLIVQRRPVDVAWLRGLVDTVVLPALGVDAP